MIKRNEKIDFLKGLAIFLVVYGHSIQYCMDNNQDFFQNPIFKFIYSFHMPLFMLISGYLYSSSIQKRNSKDLILIRFKQLIIPAIAWYSIYTMVTAIFKDTDIVSGIINYLKGIPYQFWFLFTLFYLSIISIVVNKYFNDRPIYYIALYMILLIIPDKLNIQYLKFMYPYFLIGYYYRKHKEIFDEYKTILFKVSIIMFIILILGWKKEFYIYTTGMSLYNVNIIEKIFIICYRYIIGLIGSIVIIGLSDKLYKFDKYKIFSKLGKHTLEIYIIQSYIMIGLDKLTININNTYFYNLIFTPIIAISVIMICLAVKKAILKNKRVSSILLG